MRLTARAAKHDLPTLSGIGTGYVVRGVESEFIFILQDFQHISLGCMLEYCLLRRAAGHTRVPFIPVRELAGDCR